ncbi:hypothetical protein OC835_006214, partial [Tilletia horrida]
MKLALVLPTLLLALSTAHASSVPPQVRISDSNLALRASAGTVRPGKLCTIEEDGSSDCAITDCDSVWDCTSDGSCGSLCSLLGLGEPGCLNDAECSAGGCVRGTCALVPIGGACLLHRACASNFCDETGTCIDASSINGVYSKYHLCTNDKQCRSGDCSDRWGTAYLCRQNLGICEVVAHCGPQALGQPCTATSDCEYGACTAGICQYSPVGATCQAYTECRTLSCNSGLCQARGGGEYCVDSSGCSTGACILSNGPMTPGTCKQNDAGGYCRDHRDCTSAHCNTSMHSCLAGPGATCSAGATCASGTCRGGKCSKYSRKAICSKGSQCLSGSCVSGAPKSCGPQGCFTQRWCKTSGDGGQCLADSDCAGPSFCKDDSSTQTGMCSPGPRPAATTTTATTTSSKPSTSVKSTISTTSMTSVKSTTSSEPITSSKTTTLTKATSTTKSASSTHTPIPTRTCTTSAGTPKPSAATCTTNAQCASTYCRKRLLGDGLTRATAGLCEVKKSAGARCYQDGGC